VDVYLEDVAVGTWNIVKFSGAQPATRVRELTDRADKLQQAVKYAREQANMTAESRSLITGGFRARRIHTAAGEFRSKDVDWS